MRETKGALNVRQSAETSIACASTCTLPDNRTGHALFRRQSTKTSETDGSRAERSGESTWLLKLFVPGSGTQENVGCLAPLEVWVTCMDESYSAIFHAMMMHTIRRAHGGS